MRNKRFDCNGFLKAHKITPAGKVARESDPTENATAEKLVNKYLCEGKRSECVKTGNCSELKHCIFGQRYLEAIKNEKE